METCFIWIILLHQSEYLFLKFHLVSFFIAYCVLVAYVVLKKGGGVIRLFEVKIVGKCSR